MKKDNILLELIVGIILWGLLCQIILLVGFKDYLYNAIGLWCGIAVAAGMAIHMKRSIEDILDIPNSFAEQNYRAGFARRMLGAMVVIAVVFYFELGNPLSLLAGIFSLKISAYSQPYMHKIFQKFQKSK